MSEAEDEFREFAVAVQGHLRRSAYLLCGDWHLAEDIVQSAFVKIFRVWRRVRKVENQLGYARQVVYRCFLDQYRKDKKQLPTVPIAGAADHVLVESVLDDSSFAGVVVEALAELPPRARAVIVLRFWEDMSVEQAATVLGVTTGTVKSQTSRAVAQLRGRLAAGLNEQARW
ncbi:RNA polymerase, sigma-24 subunit, ECF subfamily [Catenulispora acidiphila DSM 44928]|uniref:RNA polymerase, sigma-24 subunit, ECF subfamily n=1 Tax=Catenulispora acidiphila (strain DSM 44928 / JCM 14897 / NBRC 102108 / NRRL B-24433 / ID139908) TaxID=479433 RepID=C7QG32_CATAD|nr:SigE family RNA polymerase sigma factor [Catenulispora acidiphila]ACU71009.1 RNA polymerase, sigma-24 subunit, ECF subfamily [Catenulispora acidiphila DSM 44928]